MASNTIQQDLENPNNKELEAEEQNESILTKQDKDNFRQEPQGAIKRRKLTQLKAENQSLNNELAVIQLQLKLAKKQQMLMQIRQELEEYQ